MVQGEKKKLRMMMRRRDGQSRQESGKNVPNGSKVDATTIFMSFYTEAVQKKQRSRVRETVKGNGIGESQIAPQIGLSFQYVDLITGENLCQRVTSD